MQEGWGSYLECGCSTPLTPSFICAQVTGSERGVRPRHSKAKLSLEFTGDAESKSGQFRRPAEIRGFYEKVVCVKG
jgi:hypothetical protein